MCQYCERRTDVKFGWNQPKLCDENWKHPSDSIQDTVSSNLNVNGKPDWEARIYDYQTSTPKLIITSKNIAKVLWGDGTATIYIPIHYCPVCGRKLGNAVATDTNVENNDEIIEMIKLDDDTYVPRECCTFTNPVTSGGMSLVDDVDMPCGADCENDCSSCIIQMIMNEYAKLTKQVGEKQ